MAFESLVDYKLRVAHEQGAFERLAGHGKPFRREAENPFEDPSMRLAYRVMRNNGITLPWIVEQQALDTALIAARSSLAHAWQRYLDAEDAGRMNEREEQRWEQAHAAFHARIAEINRRLLSYNLSVPLGRFQRPLLQVDAEVERVIQPITEARDAERAAALAEQRRHAAQHVTLASYLALARTYLNPQRRSVALLTVLLFGSIALQLFNPLVLRQFIDSAASDSGANRLWQSALLFLALVFGGQVLSALATYVSEAVAWTATNALRLDLALHCLRLDLSFHKAHTPGELIERVDGDVATLSNFFSQLVIRVIGNSLLLLGVLAVVAREDWRAGLSLVAYVAASLLVLQRTRDIAVPSIAASRKSTADLQGFWEERLGGTPDIRANGAVAYTLRRNAELLRKAMRAGVKVTMLYRAFVGVWIVTFLVGNALALGVSSYLFRTGVLTIGTVYLIFYYTNLVSLNLGVITEQINDLQHATTGIQRINELLHIPVRLLDGPATPPSGPLAVEFRSVSFDYEDERRTTNDERPTTNETASSIVHRPLSIVLHDISFRLEPGKVLGLLGRSGSGKTTIARLLFRFYDPQHGTVLVGSRNIRQYRLMALRQRIGMVTQDVQLFHASVRDNLSFWNSQIPDEHILDALEALGLAAWLGSLPHGLDTLLQPGSAGLSAGEAQLLAFTRVFLQNPGLVILDEASSRLDPASERMVERAIDRLLRGRTAIIIAHRLATVQRADQIMILEDGHVQEHGERTQLARDPRSRFARLLQSGLEEVLA